MRIELYTLVDITLTGVRHANGNNTKFLQQSNYNTILQTLSLTTNIQPISIAEHYDNINPLGFGSKFRNRHKYWYGVFESAYESTVTRDILHQNFNLIPIIINLTETAKIEPSVIEPTDEQRQNIIFNLVY